MADEETAALVGKICPAATVNGVLRNDKLVATIKAVVEEAGGASFLESGSSSALLNVYHIATRFPEEAVKHRGHLVREYLVTDKLDKPQLDAAVFYFKTNAKSNEINWREFEEKCGIGVVVTEKDVRAELDKYFSETPDLLESKGWGCFGATLGKMKKRLPFADGLTVKEVLSAVLEERLGPKQQAKKPTKGAGNGKKGGKSKAAEKKPKESTLPSSSTLPPALEFRFPDPKDNIQKTPELLEKHLKETGGKVMTRFPPEPNGFLHIGHAKSINLNFSYAESQGGHCYLRFDDTNPAAEKQEYIDSILESVTWLGFTPYKTTYSSQYFDELYECAIKLIKKGKAYVCHLEQERMQKERKEGIDSPYRNRSVEENLVLFEDMRKGKYGEGEAVLRVKGDMKHENMNMRDFVAYRVIYRPHPKAGDRWCIYPSYDFTHCIVDSIENITHSLCSMEFRIRRETYNWLLHELGMYCPPQIEFSRLNVNRCMTSKRKIKKMIDLGIVAGWDDPRIPTLMGLKRRGYTPESLRDLCRRVGVTETEMRIDYSMVEECLRQDLNVRAVRGAAVLYPLKVTITNWSGEAYKTVEAPNFPSDPSKGCHSVVISKSLYIEQDDFRRPEDVTKKYFRLAPGRVVGLKNFGEGNIRCTDAVYDEAGKPIELKCELVPKEKVKAHIHWVADPAPNQTPQRAEVRLYEDLFNVDKPDEFDDWTSLVNKQSVTILKDALLDPFLAGLSGTHYAKAQFERVGFFSVDPDSTSDRPVWNRAVSLKDGFKKAEAKK